MHELGRFVRSLMDQERMTPPDLVRRSGLSRQHVHTLLNAETLGRLPESKTFTGLHQAFPAVPRNAFILTAAAAIGVPVDLTAIEADYSQLSNETLVGILMDRLQGGQTDGRTLEAEKIAASSQGDVTLAARPGSSDVDRYRQSIANVGEETQVNEDADYT